MTHEKKINDENTEYQYQQYEIKSHDSAGWEYTPNAPIFIEVLDNNEIVVKVDGKPITKTPLVSKTVEATEMEKVYYEKYVKNYCQNKCSLTRLFLVLPTLDGDI